MPAFSIGLSCQQSLSQAPACDTLNGLPASRCATMKPKALQRVFVLTIGVFLVFAVQAMPPAPQGPYLSIEDDFNRAASAGPNQGVPPGAEMRQSSPPPVNRSAGPVQRQTPQYQAPAIRPGANTYYPDQRNSRYPGYPQGKRSQY